MCSFCRTARNYIAAIDAATDRIKARLADEQVKLADDVADGGFNCCTSNEIRLLETIINALSFLEIGEAELCSGSPIADLLHALTEKYSPGKGRHCITLNPDNGLLELTVLDGAAGIFRSVFIEHESELAEGKGLISKIAEMLPEEVFSEIVSMNLAGRILRQHTETIDGQPTHVIDDVDVTSISISAEHLTPDELAIFKEKFEQSFSKDQGGCVKEVTIPWEAFSSSERAAIEKALKEGTPLGFSMRGRDQIIREKES